MSGGPSNSEPAPARGRLRLPRRAVLRGRKPFKLLFQAGRSMRSPMFDFRYRWVDTQPPVAKVGFVVGKRLGNAVARNRVRRQLREAYRLCAPGFAELAQRRGQALEGAFIAKSTGLQHLELLRVMSDFIHRLAPPAPEQPKP